MKSTIRYITQPQKTNQISFGLVNEAASMTLECGDARSGLKNHYAKKYSDRTVKGYFMGYTPTRSILRWWNPKSNKITLATGAKFNELNYLSPSNQQVPGCDLHNEIHKIKHEDLPHETVDTTDHPFYDSPPEEILITIPESKVEYGIEIDYCDYYNLSYIIKTRLRSHLFNQLPSHLRYNSWIVSIDNKEPIQSSSVLDILGKLSKEHPNEKITLILVKRSQPTRTSI